MLDKWFSQLLNPAALHPQTVRPFEGEAFRPDLPNGITANRPLPLSRTEAEPFFKPIHHPGRAEFDGYETVAQAE